MKVKRGNIIYISEKLKVELGKNIQSLRRPYIVISNDINNALGPVINIAPLSGQIHKRDLPTHVFVSADDYNINRDSIVLLEQILTINKEYVIEVKDILNKKDMELVDKAIFVQLIDEKKKFKVI